MYQGGPPLGQEGLQWGEVKLCHQAPQEVNLHTLQGGECSHQMLLRNKERKIVYFHLFYTHLLHLLCKRRLYFNDRSLGMTKISDESWKDGCY